MLFEEFKSLSDMAYKERFGQSDEFRREELITQIDLIYFINK